jgi:hypothetical protein
MPVTSFQTPWDAPYFLSAAVAEHNVSQMLQSIAQLLVFALILLHQKHVTKAGVAIAMTEIIQFSEIQFFYMIL